MKVRDFKSKDVDGVITLWEEKCDYYNSFDKNLYVGVSDSEIENYANSAKSTIGKKDLFLMVAEDKEKIVGYVWGSIIKDDSSKIGKISDLMITDEMRRHGIGKSLVEGMSNQLMDNGCSKVKVSIFAKNKPAVKVYEAAGFKTHIIEMKKE